MNENRFFARMEAQVPKRHLLGAGSPQKPQGVTQPKAGSMNENRWVTVG
jgi:hypothetical protein